MVFAFLSWYSIAMYAVLGYVEAIVQPIRPFLIYSLKSLPVWAQPFVEIGFEIVVFSLPQLLLALIGGALARKLELTVRFEHMGPK